MWKNGHQFWLDPIKPIPIHISIRRLAASTGTGLAKTFVTTGFSASGRHARWSTTPLMTQRDSDLYFPRSKSQILALRSKKRVVAAVDNLPNQNWRQFFHIKATRSMVYPAGAFEQKGRIQAEGALDRWIITGCKRGTRWIQVMSVVKFQVPISNNKFF